MKKYYVLIIDLVKSRSLNEKERFIVQKKLDIAINCVNKLMEENIASLLSFSAGDSVQGLFNTLISAYDAYHIIKSSVHPYEIRAGIGYGQINAMMIENIEFIDSNKYDGQAYHKAREAIEVSKKFHDNLVIKVNDKFDEMINPIIEDSNIVSMTSLRMTIYSLINTIDPLIDKRHHLSSDYFDMITPLILEMVNYYRENSRVAYDNKSINEKLNIEQVSLLLIEYYFAYKNNQDNSIISTATRTLLVALTGSREQNVNSMIKISKMDDLRSRIVSKRKILKYLYEEV